LRGTCLLLRSPLLINQPAEHLGRTIGAVADDLGRAEIEAGGRALDHAFGGQNFSLPDRCGCLDVDNDRVLKVDQIIGRVGKEGLPAMGTGPARRRIGWRDELGRDLGRSAKGGIVEHSQVLFDCPTGSFRWQPLLTFDPLLPVGVRLDQAGIDGKGFATNQTFSDAAPQDCLKDVPQQIALAETAVPVLAEGGVIGHLATKIEAAKPPVSQIEVNLLAEAPLRPDAEAIADNQHSDHQLGINRGPAHAAVKRCQLPPQIAKFNEPIDRPQQMIRWNVPV